ncbi:TonB-dependent receptor domain-containing protein [Marinobacterium arenosum]|uniref:TonB-dependent receptor domain-containing protein n=1 Tax=Marinobacterium arenosum TaxID=2862496 RepID=UPI001C93C7DD|nr:TonB-dependent receptor [Marinobacterium arenosum]MBY4678599.1 TonB-dependent receptor [Marinobacterium arenosum]
MYRQLTLAAAVAAALPAYASTTLATTPSNLLETVVVSANRIAQPLTNTIAPVNVITREQLERNQVRTLQQALKLLPGVSFRNRGGAHQTSSLFMRGTNSDHTLILLNGQRINSATAGSTDFQFLPIEQIERIEVVRGPRSAQYGSDAIGGIIQIFTRKGTSEPLAQLTASAGTLGNRSLSGSYSGQYADGGFFALNLGVERSDGYDVRDGDETDDDGYLNRSFGLSIDQQLDDRWSVDGQLNYWEGNTEYDPHPAYGGDNENDFRNYAAAVSLDYQGERWHSRLTLAASEDNNTNYTDGQPKSDGSKFITERRELNWLNSLQLDDHLQATLGVDLRNDDVGDSTVDYAVTSRDVWGAFTGLIYSRGDWDLDASIRHTDDDQFGTHFTYSLGAQYQINPQLAVTASHGTAFKAPSFNELYYPFFGDPDLEPEESKSYEIGLRGEHGLRWALNLYRTDVTDLISAPPPTYQIGNVDKAEIRGLELELGFDTGPLSHQLNLEYIDAEDSLTGKTLVYRPEHNLKWLANYSYNQFDVGSELLYVGKRYADASNSSELPSYLLVDLYASWRPQPQWLLGVRIDNLLDRDYVPSSGYKSQDQTVTVSARYTF